MKNIYLKIAGLVVLSLVLGLWAVPAKAFTPTLSLSGAGGDSVQVSVYGDANSRIDLSFNQSGSQLPTTIGNFGTTSGNGAYHATVSGSQYGIPSGALVYVTVNGQQSSAAVWPGYGGGCYGTNCGGGSLNLSHTNVTLSAGQSVTVTAYNLYGGSLYVNGNTNSSVASASVSGNSVTIYGNSSGSTTITVCSNATGYGSCGSIYATVTGSGCYGSNCVGGLSFNPSSLSLNAGQTASVSLSSGVNMSAYPPYVSSNSNPNVASASISGSQMTVYGNAGGSTAIAVCLSGGNTCANLHVTVSGYSNPISFSQSNVSMNVGQNVSVSVYGGGGSGSYYISSNSNSGAVSASIAGSTLSLRANYSGSSTISVCSYNSSASCGSVYVNATGGNVSLSQTNLSLSVGQSASVTGTGNYSGNLYISSNSNPSVANASVSGSQVTVYGNSAGSATLNVCSTVSGSGSCAALYVTVSGTCYGTSCSSGSLYFQSTQLPSPTVGQYYSSQLQASGGTAPYTYTIVSGSLPSGLNMSSSGQVFGTPQSAAAGTFTVQVSDYYGRTATSNITLTPQCNGCVLGTSTYSNGTLVSEGGTVYIIYRNTKTPFASRAAFEGLGFNFGSVASAYTGLPSSGYIITTSNVAHPWGSWIKSGTTVYFVHETGLIPVTDYNTFVSNGGQDRFVVQANGYDFQRPMLSAMAINDSRLR